MAEPNFGSWSVGESPITIEYSLVVIEEIRQLVTEGFQKLSRGGIEVGGILYGTRDGRTVRILSVSPIHCEHARGPAFLLSDNDRAALAEQLRTEAEGTAQQNLVCIGWFLSHTRSEIRLSDTDVDVYNEYFSAPWQVTMVVRPGRVGAMRAGFFVRESDGSVNVERSYLEFNFPDRLSGVLDAAPRTERRQGERRRNWSPPENPTLTEMPRRPNTGPFPVPQPMEAPQFLPAPPPRKRWPWLVAWGAIVVALAVLGLRYFLSPSAPAPVSLTLMEREGQLLIEWNNNAKPVVSAERGALAITDGPDVQNVTLTSRDLAAGRFTYQRKTGDIEVRLTVQDANGTSVQEASRYLGKPPVKVDPEELSTLEARRAELEAQVKRLQGENAAQAEKIQQLERTLRIMQTRLGLKQ